MRPTLLVLLFLASIPWLPAASAQDREDPRLVVRRAAAAVRGDSVGPLRIEWERRAARADDSGAALGLASLARLTYDYPGAERRYRALIASATPSDRYAVYALLGLGQASEEYGRDAEPLFVQALEAARRWGDSAAIGEALTWLGYVRSRSSGLEVAVAHYDTALRILPPGAADLRATAECRRAQALVLTGKHDASAALSRALDAAGRLGLPRVMAPCVRGRAAELGHQGAFEAAAALYEQLAERYRVAHDPSGRALILAWAAAVYREDLANYARARHALALAQADARTSHNRYADVITGLYQGQISLTLNDYAAAQRYLDAAVAAAEEVGDGEALAVSRSWRALVRLAMGDLDRARQESLETLEFFQHEGDLENQSEVVQTLANIAIRARDWPAAERALDSSEALLRRLGASPDQVAQAYERGRLALYRGDLPVAERAFGGYLERLDSASHLQRYEVQAYLAEIHARRGDLDAAQRGLAAASAELDRWRAGLGARDLRITAFQANTNAQNDRNASVARVLAALAGGGRTEAAFDLAERRRARELTDRLTQERSLEPGTRTDRGSVTGSPEQLDAREIAERLPRHTALLEYVTGAYGAPTTLFVLSRSAADPSLSARVLVPADSLTGPIARLLALVTRGADISREAKALGTSLLDPAMALLGPDVTRLIIVPDGVLHRVPWDALRLEDGRDAVERFAIGLAPSATLALALEGPGGPVAPRREGRVLAFGDPTFAAGGDAVASTYQAAFTAEGGLPRLPGSGEEVRALTRYAAADLLLGRAASERRLKTTALGRYSVLHFATHALVDDRIAVRTALALTPGEGEDGFVTPGELARLRLNADLVVLSGCRTAGGVVVDGEGMQGLTAPLLEAGARNVVATSWRVGDERIVPLVGQFYAALSRGLPVADALREAKLDARARGAAPAVWSAFTVVGDPLATVALRPFARPDPGP